MESSPPAERGPAGAELRTRLPTTPAARRLERISDALTGGVHTPNHRWELCAALARIHSLQAREGRPRPEILARIGQWLAEGIDQLPDGMYSERSPLYATAVTNPSLLAIADHAGRPELLEHVRRNLAAFLPWFNQDGTTESYRFPAGRTSGSRSTPRPSSCCTGGWPTRTGARTSPPRQPGSGNSRCWNRRRRWPGRASIRGWHRSSRGMLRSVVPAADFLPP